MYYVMRKNEISFTALSRIERLEGIKWGKKGKSILFDRIFLKNARAITTDAAKYIFNLVSSFFFFFMTHTKK